MEKPELINLLNHLIVTAKNGASSLRAAGDEAHHAELKRSLYEYSQFYASSAAELQEAVRKLGGTPKEIGTFGNTLHRTWMHLKLTALGRDEDELLNEVETEEEEVERRYGEAVHETLQDEADPEMRKLIERQFQTALRHHERIADMHRSIHRYS